MAIQKRALSDFLKTKRAKLKPVDVGLMEYGPRRVPGLRREEVAALAGVSIYWCARLEQGRQVTPSAAVLDAIAAALRLDDIEREYLFNLARPSSERGSNTDLPAARPGISRMIHGFVNQPSFLLGPRMEVLEGNDAAWALLADFPSRPAHDRNILR
ncbi:helix-turn-helix domain-containing protein [Bifidobacterium tsurumiense]|uniref:Helix-turn-helix domain-containing protein n=1 Tax=Bifidobacterium tsurumiense TaxID=356829 RepID=A0A087EBH8_9BIFI|nr:helix-turn-helix domain-containing protein [Bifidobacterium tsurumiense]